MLKWTDKIDGIDDIMAEDVNTLAHSIIENENIALSLQRQTEENTTAIENFKSEVATTYETKTGASTKLTEAKDYTDTEIRETTIRLWQPNTEYKVGDYVFVIDNSMTIEIYKCTTAHNSSNSFDSSQFERHVVALSDNATHASVASRDDGGNTIHTTYATKTELSSYSQKPTIITDNTSTTYNLEFLGSTNKIIRLTAPALSELNLVFNDGEYNSDLLVNLVFTSGDTPPQIAYPNTGIINWIGTDCALSAGKSVFTPSANTKYDIVFSFDGSQLVGYVCGYTPATVDNTTGTGNGATN